MIQFDHVLAINGSMIANGSFNDNTNYVSMNNFEWDGSHEYWKPKFTFGDKYVKIKLGEFNLQKKIFFLIFEE